MLETLARRRIQVNNKVKEFRAKYNTKELNKNIDFNQISKLLNLLDEAIEGILSGEETNKIVLLFYADNNLSKTYVIEGTKDKIICECNKCGFIWEEELLENKKCKNCSKKKLECPIDKYLEEVNDYDAKSITVSYLCQKFNIHPQIIREVLELYCHNGILKQRLHYFCPIEEGGLKYFELGEDIPKIIPCDLCDEEKHKIDTKDLVVEYELIFNKKKRFLIRPII